MLALHGKRQDHKLKNNNNCIMGSILYGLKERRVFKQLSEENKNQDTGRNGTGYRKRPHICSQKL